MKETKLIPIGDRIVVKPIEEASQTAGGIYIPDANKEKPQKGEVLSVGAGRILESGIREKIEVEQGDIILFSKYGGSEVKIDGQNYIILSSKDVLVIIR